MPQLPTLNLDELERAAIVQALEKCSQNRTKAAQVLGIDVRTLQRKLKHSQESVIVTHEPRRAMRCP